MSSAVTDLLSAVLHDRPTEAVALLTRHPDLVRTHVAVAAAAGDADALTALLAADAGGATNTSDTAGIAPLMFAVQQPVKDALQVSAAARYDVVRLLLDAGADPNSTVPFGDPVSRISALYFVSTTGHEPLVRLLLERGAQPDDGESVYHAAQHDHRACLATLLEFGADLSGRHTVHGNTPLYFLASHRARNPITPTVLRGMAWLLEHGADPTVPSIAAPTAAHTATAGETPLHRIAAGGHDPATAMLLIAHGAAVDPPRADGRTPLALAIRSGNGAMVECLLGQGADASRVTARDAYVGACARADETAARALLQQTPSLRHELQSEDGDALLDAIEDDRAASVALMLTLGWPLTTESAWGGTPLHWAAWRGRVTFVRQLIAAGAPINVRDRAYGSSPIAWAAHGSRYADHAGDVDYVAIVGALLDAGATRDASFNQWGESPESMAIEPVREALAARGFLATPQ
jgi:ankyrin repeat protein